jgi:pimeloyl-ACP methyl ester carboxylesterase
MPYSMRNGVSIYYEVNGAGPALVLVHANPFDHRLWTYQVARFSQFFTVIAIDLRGYGRSEKVETPYTLRDLAADVLGVCADENITRAIFAGVSVGSGIAMLLGLEHEEIVEAVVLVGGSTRGPAANLPRIVSGLEEAPDLAAYLLGLMRGYVAPGFADTPTGAWLLDLFVENAHTLSRRAIAQVFTARASLDMSTMAPAMKVPTLIVNGEFDNSLKAARETATLIPHAEHVVLANAGHACCLEVPAAFDAAVTSFLERHGLWPKTSVPS